MNLTHLKDAVLLSQIKDFVQAERDLLVKILQHLREIERRRLFSDLGYRSLFDYAVGELKYSEGQASRRIQAMRLLKELPQVEEKIATGSLNLSNVQQAQSFFRHVQQNEPRRIITADEKLEILGKLENKSFREGQKELLKLEPEHALPKETERLVTTSTTEVRFLMTEDLKAKFEHVRSLLGIKGATMNYAELFDAMAELSTKTLKAKRFGKRRSQKSEVSQTAKPKEESLLATSEATFSTDDIHENVAVSGEGHSSEKNFEENVSESKKEAPLATSQVTTPTIDNSSDIATATMRYISKALKHEVWQRDEGACQQCGSRKNLNYDHVQPVALGGKSTWGNLRLLCFFCNQRASAKHFGVWRGETKINEIGCEG
jgi:hypothetical protein